MILNIGHRGAGNHSIENTLESIKLAIQWNIDMVEIDVQILPDDSIIVFHDSNLYRMTGIDAPVRQYNFEQVAQIKLISRRHKYSQLFSYIPLLENVLELIKGNIGINIELKQCDNRNWRLVKRVLELLDKYELLYSNNTLLSSFSMEILSIIEKEDPKIKKGVLINRSSRKMNAAIQNFHLYSIHPNKLYLTQKMMNRFRDNQLKVYPWTVNSAKNMERLCQWPVDGIITNYPLKLSNILMKNQWL